MANPIVDFFRSLHLLGGQTFERIKMDARQEAIGCEVDLRQLEELIKAKFISDRIVRTAFENWLGDNCFFCQRLAMTLQAMAAHRPQLLEAIMQAHPELQVGTMDIAFIFVDPTGITVMHAVVIDGQDMSDDDPTQELEPN